MPKHHISPATGIALPCVDFRNCDVHIDDHYLTRKDAVDASMGKWQDVLNRSMSELKADREFINALGYAVAEGFTISTSKGTRLYEAQVKLLHTKVGIKYLVGTILVDNSNATVRATAKIMNWVIRSNAQKKKKAFNQTFDKVVAPLALDKRVKSSLLEILEMNDAENHPQRIAQAAANLWAYRDSPMHVLAQALVYGDVGEASGYHSNELRYFSEITHTEEVLQKMNVAFESLPYGVLAYDVETDTQNGFGLLPLKTQITEVVVSRKDKSWVIAGDEKFILTKFAELLNSQQSGSVLAGWNNRSFDNVVLQTRAEHHDISGWGGVLMQAPNASMYETVSPSGFLQSLVWTTPAGVVLRDVDVFQDKLLSDRSTGMDRTVGLKSFVEGLGCTPIKVDRDRLHTLSEDERVAYVLSDGIATLRAYFEML